jgi:tRNA threonylcarbamoyladenosine biosynthesis protein TsaB
MILLVTDTSGKNGRVALARADNGAKSNQIEIIEETPIAGGTFSAQLVPQIAALLAGQGLSKTDIDAFVVVSGPGSFTGLRVGLAVVKGLAEILRKPIVPVSLLEAVALASRCEGKVVAALDAGRGEVYVGEYKVTGASPQLVGEQLMSKDEFLSATRESAVATPDEIWAGIARDAGHSVCKVAPLGGEAIAALGWKKMQSGESVAPEQLEANYIRRTDAEIFAKSNQAANPK